MTDEDMPLESLHDSAPDGFVVCDEDSTIVWANQTAHDLFGYAAGELIGIGIEELVPQRLRGDHAKHRHDYMASPRVRTMGLGLNLLAVKKDGREFPVEISLSPLRTAQRSLITAVIRDVTERRRLEDEGNMLRVELETERERDRIAMDLHDGIMQDIYAAALTLELALADTEDRRFAGALGVERAIDQLHEVVRDIRSYIFDLRPRQFSGTLMEALSNLAQEFSQNSQIETNADVSEGTVDLAAAVALYHIAHEALSNIQRHAQASGVAIRLSFEDGTGELLVIDDGVGFDTSGNRPEQHRGLRNMFARAASIGAEIDIESAPNKGTRLSVTFPVRPHLS